MSASGRFTFWIRAVQALALAVAVCFSLGATDAGSRFNDPSHRLMCTCGCAEILGECNHVGCPNSTGELNELQRWHRHGYERPADSGWLRRQIRRSVLAAPTTAGIRPGGLDCALRGLCRGAAGHDSAGPQMVGRQDADRSSRSPIRPWMRSEKRFAGRPAAMEVFDL